MIETISKIDLKKVDQAIELFRNARERDKHIFVCGNGGSASTASHFACDIVKGASYERPKRFRILSAYGFVCPRSRHTPNDVSYDCVFAEQLKNFAQPGDLVMAISSGSGNSPSVLRAVEYGNSVRMHHSRADRKEWWQAGVHLRASTYRWKRHTWDEIEDAHMIVCHMIGYSLMESEVC